PPALPTSAPPPPPPASGPRAAANGPAARNGPAALFREERRTGAGPPEGDRERAEQHCGSGERPQIRAPSQDAQGIWGRSPEPQRSEEHTSELQSRGHLV